MRWIRQENVPHPDPMRGHGANMALRALLIKMQENDDALRAASGMAFCGEYLGAYKPGQIYGKSSPYFALSPVDGFPAVVLTVGAWMHSWSNEDLKAMKATAGGGCHFYIERDTFDGEGVSDPPVAGNPIFFWHWNTTSMRHLAGG